YYRTCATSSCTAVSTDYQLPIVPAGTTVILRDGRTRIAFLALAGTGTCAIYNSAPRSTPVYR
ncbi:MAG TPA: hypothetical protein VMK12_29095, partial [Anaeromyxobacteraceae bacterium]|nr:hypothetical protein [Anaeromyxobacteraceae bacterium]